MKKYMYLLSVLFCLLFISCKKENVNGDLRKATGEQLEKIKKYYADQQSLVLNDSKSINEGEPLWEKTIFDAEQNKYLTPLAVSSKKATGKYAISKYLQISGANDELKGENVFVLEKAGDSKRLNDLQIQNMVLQDAGTPNVTIAKRDFYSGLPGKNFRPGKYINTRIRKEQKSDTTVVTNSLPMANCEANGGIIVEIEWWYQEYDQYGHVVYEEYVYSTYECWASGGGGSGGGGSTTGTSAACGSITSEQA